MVMCIVRSVAIIFVSLSYAFHSLGSLLANKLHDHEFIQSNEHLKSVDKQIIIFGRVLNDKFSYI